MCEVKDTTIKVAPNRNIIRKSADLFLKEPSSSIRQYRYVNNIVNKKLNPNVPKNKNVVTSLHTCPLRISIGLKYNWNGDASSSCYNKICDTFFKRLRCVLTTASVVITQAVV